MMDFGWKKKAEFLRMAILSGAHQIAKPLPRGLVDVLDVFHRVHTTKDGSGLEADMARIQAAYPDDKRPIWEPINVHGWEIIATMYRRDEQLWWLVHAERKNGGSPGSSDVKILDKVLNHLGGVSTDAVICPTSSPDGAPLLQFGWWTWRNVAPLYEVQVNKHVTGKKMIRIVRLGTPETDGYISVDLREPNG